MNKPEWTTLLLMAVAILSKAWSYPCSLPDDISNFSLIAEGDAKIEAQSVTPGIYVGLVFQQILTDNLLEVNGMSYVRDMQADNVDWNGGLRIGSTVADVVDFKQYEFLAENLEAYESGSSQVYVLNDNGGGCWTNEDFGSPGPGDTLVVFNTWQDVCFYPSDDGSPFFPTILAPFSRVEFLAGDVQVAGTVIAREIEVSGTSQGDFKNLTFSGIPYVGELACRETAAPSTTPTVSAIPSDYPSSSPSFSMIPTVRQSGSPSYVPSDFPSLAPSIHPSSSFFPSDLPSYTPSVSQSPSVQPSSVPSDLPSVYPSQRPSISQGPSLMPSSPPTLSAVPSDMPSTNPTETPSIGPNVQLASKYPSQLPSPIPFVSQPPSAVELSGVSGATPSLPTSWIPTSSPILTSSVSSSTPTKPPSLVKFYDYEPERVVNNPNPLSLRRRTESVTIGVWGSQDMSTDGNENDTV